MLPHCFSGRANQYERPGRKRDTLLYDASVIVSQHAHAHLSTSPRYNMARFRESAISQMSARTPTPARKISTQDFRIQRRRENANNRSACSSCSQPLRRRVRDRNNRSKNSNKKSTHIMLENTRQAIRDLQKQFRESRQEIVKLQDQAQNQNLVRQIRVLVPPSPLTLRRYHRPSSTLSSSLACGPGARTHVLPA